MTTNNAINNTLPLPFTVGSTSITALPIDKINVQTITATGAFTYTKTAGTQYAIFELQGDGGGSGGAGGAASQGSVAGGGSGGGYLKILVSGSANLAAITGSVGAGGAAGTSGNNNGGNGSGTNLTINSGTQWVAAGGNGGNGGASSAISSAGGLMTSSANTVGTNGTTILNIKGGTSGVGCIGASASAPYIGSSGGSSILGVGTPAYQSAVAGLLYGSGAGGGSNPSASNIAGAQGAQGIVIVTEFIAA